MPSLTAAAVKERALAMGFDLCGVALADRHPRLARLESWLAEGRAGDMTYLADSADERADAREALPTARSVISLAVVYNTSAAAAPSGGDRPIIARYARGEDYHAVIRGRLRRLLAWLADQAGPGFEAFTCVDDGPVQERVFAEQAGLGWIGKNTCVINPQLGSWIFLAEIVTSAELVPDGPAVDQCGTCTRCLDACPTGALVAPYELDATRCLSYLTIEQRGWVGEEWRAAIGPRVFGCDICQEVCPWNRRAAESDDPAWATRPALAAPTLLDLCRWSDEEWHAVLRGSAMRRAGLRRLRRTLAFSTIDVPAETGVAALALLESHPSASQPEVADAIAWARARIGTRQPPGAVEGGAALP